MPTASDKPGPSKVEKAKQASNYLRGTLEQVLASDDPAFAHDDSQLLKFHGTYQQYDRDQRKASGQGKTGRAYQFMVRVRIPAGRLTADQYLQLDAITDALCDGSLRVTSRQGLQFHGVLKGDLRTTLSRINRSLLTTLGACGDVSRNVMMSPAPPGNALEERILAYAQEVAQALRPASRAYHEIWLDGEKTVQADNAEQEPFYGSTYLPRKFKVGFALPGDNSVDLYTQDIGFLPVVEDGAIQGVNITVGGGLGTTHNKPDTFARLGSHLGSVEPSGLVEAAQVVASIFRDFGNRSDRRHARLKYLIHERGLDWFGGEFEKRFSGTLHPWIDVGRLTVRDHIGRHAAGDGSFYYGVCVDNGRIRDIDSVKTRTALRTAVAELQPDLVLTPQQNVLLINLTAPQIDRLEQILTEHGLALAEQISPARRLSLACPALPTCGLAISESERVMPTLLAQFENLLSALGLANERISLRMTGCPNGCVRPYTAEIGLVGRTADTYDIYIGGTLAGDRLTDLYREKVPLGDIMDALRPLLTAWRDERQAPESFGDYWQRVHHQGPALVILTGAKLASRSPGKGGSDG